MLLESAPSEFFSGNARRRAAYEFAWLFPSVLLALATLAAEAAERAFGPKELNSARPGAILKTLTRCTAGVPVYRQQYGQCRPLKDQCKCKQQTDDAAA